MGKKILYGFLTMILFILIMTGCQLYKFYESYDIPPLDQNISIDDLNLDFEEEKQVFQSLTKTFNNDHINNIDEKNIIEGYSLSKKLVENGEVEEAISYLKKIVQVEPTNLIYLNQLRVLYLELNQTDSFLDFTKTLPQTYEVKLNNALAYVDYLQSPDLGTANLGQKSVQSITILEELINENTYDLLARYARGLNNLYWPSGLQRTTMAIDDLTFCVSAEEEFGDHYFEFWPDCYITLGDAYVKDGDVEKGKQVWKKGKQKYPDNPELMERANLSNDEAIQLVTEVRGIDIFQRPDPSITDLSVIWE